MVVGTFLALVSEQMYSFPQGTTSVQLYVSINYPFTAEHLLCKILLESPVNCW